MPDAKELTSGIVKLLLLEAGARFLPSWWVWVMSMGIRGSEFAVAALDSQLGMLVLTDFSCVCDTISLVVEVLDCSFTTSLLGVPSTIGVMNHHVDVVWHVRPPFLS